jgi:hypothetical protein
VDWTEEMQQRRAAHMALPKEKRKAAFRAFSQPFQAEVRQLVTPAIAVDWFLLGVSGEDAAAWANLGFMPAEAAATIRSGITPQQYREMEDHAEAQAGGSDALAALRITELHASGVLSRDDVVTVQDPFDPGVELIAPRDEV